MDPTEKYPTMGQPQGHAFVTSRDSTQRHNLFFLPIKCKVSDIGDTINHVENKMWEFVRKEELQKLKLKMVDLEDRWCRNNITIRGDC